MKTTIYELLGMVKDGKAPKLIKYDDMIWEYGDYYRNEKKFILEEWCDLFTSLNDEVEIIEDTPKEDKKISKDIEWYMIDFQDQEKTKVAQTNMNFKIMREKIYELIDTINEMKGKE